MIKKRLYQKKKVKRRKMIAIMKMTQKLMTRFKELMNRRLQSQLRNRSKNQRQVKTRSKNYRK